MAWRNWLQVQPMNKTDYVYAAGVIGLPNFLEVWLGIIVACLPTLTPIYAKYVKPVYSSMRGESYPSGSGSNSAREAQNTFGGGGHHRGGQRFKHDIWDDASFFDVEEGKMSSTVSRETQLYEYPSAPAPFVPKGPSGCRNLQKSLPATPRLRYQSVIENGRAIQVRSDVTVFSEPGKW